MARPNGLDSRPVGLEQRVKKTVLALSCALLVALVSPLRAEDHLVRFDGGIGVIPISNVTVVNGVTTASRNVVRGINSPGQIWVISRLRADIDTDGRIKAAGRGLLLGGGNNIGLNGGQSVLATLICDAAGTQLFTTTTPVPLDAAGNFEIDDMLTPTPTACASPVLLIRNGTGTVWFAAGILKLN
jgi:hypothetical protein